MKQDTKYYTFPEFLQTEESFNKIDAVEFVKRYKYDLYKYAQLSYSERDRYDSRGRAFINTDYDVFCYLHYLLYKRQKCKVACNDIFNPDRIKYWPYFVVGELIRSAKYRGNERSTIVFFDKNELIINSSHLYGFMCTFFDYMESLGYDLSGFKKDKLFKDPSGEKYLAFANILKRITDSRYICGKLLKNPRPKKLFVRNQEQAIRLAKTLTWEQVFEYLTQNGMQKTYTFFKDIKSMQNSGKRIYNQCEKLMQKRVIDKLFTPAHDNVVQEELKKKRINPKACDTYLKYYALLSLVQSRVKDPLEINSIIEKKFFKSGYKIMSDAMISLKWKVCLDATFCKNIKSRNYFVKVAAPVSKKVSIPKFYANNIERAFIRLGNDDSRFLFKMQYDDMSSYLESKLLINQRKTEIDDLKMSNKRIYFHYKNGSLVTKYHNYSLDDIAVNRYDIRELEKEFSSQLKTLSSRNRFRGKNKPTFYGEEFLCA